MKKNLLKLSVLLLCIFQSPAFSQRYLTEVFSSVQKTTDVIYGNNIGVLTGTPTAQDLKMDVYEPAGDILAQRPVIVFMHTGSYLPAYINQTPTGTRNDSATVAICTQFAKRGYVVANIDYRLGWNPAGSNVDIRRGTILNAIYRSIQDAKAAVRYMRKDAATTNTFKIDPNKVILGGQGTGGYIAVNYAALHDPGQIALPKFISNTTDATYGFVAGQPYVNQAFLGDYDGYGGIPQLNNPNNSVGYANDVQFTFNLGGALGDSSWVTAGNAPVVAFHTVGDPFAPYYQGIVYVPGNPPQTVVDVVGSGYIVPRSNALGNNNCFINAGFTDAYTQAANAVNGGQDGLYPFYTNPIVQAGPWEWFDSLTTVAAAQAYGLTAAQGGAIYHNAILTNPDMSKAKGLAYIDTIQNYLNPRIVYCLNLPTGISETEVSESSVNVYPNPVADFINVKSENPANKISSIEIEDITGHSVRKIEKINDTFYKEPRKNLSPGIYFVKVGFDKGVITKKIVIK